MIMTKILIFNKLAADAFNAKSAQANLITKTDFDAKLSCLNRQMTKNKSKPLLVENELKKLKIFDLSYFIGKNYFENDGAQSYLVFQPTFKYQGLIDEIIKPLDDTLSPTPGCNS